MQTLGTSPVILFIQVSKYAQTLRESFLVEMEREVKKEITNCIANKWSPIY